ncbi:16727_t:CDS:1, partial [Funneliformis caledonium]
IKEALENFQNSDDYITNEQDWNERLEDWYELLREEENALILDDGEELTDNSILNNNLLSTYIHPAVDINGKWNLRDLFIQELERPEFINVSHEFN